MVSTKSVGFSNLFPDIASSQAELARRQLIADELSKQALAPIDTNRGAGVKISPWEGAAKLGQALVAGMQQKDISKQNLALAQDQNQRMWGTTPWKNPDGANAAIPVDNGAKGLGDTLAGMIGGSGQDTMQPDLGTPQPAQNGGTGGVMGKMFPGVPQGELMMIMQSNPELIGKMLQERNTPTDAIKTLRQGGMTAEQIANAISGKANNEATLNMPANNTAFRPDGSALVAPDYKEGAAGGFDQNGQPIVRPIQGAQGVKAGMEGAIQHAKQENTILPDVVVNNRTNAGGIWGSGKPVVGDASDPTGGNGGGDGYYGGSPRGGFDTVDKDGNIVKEVKNQPILGTTPTEKTVIPAAQQSANEDFTKNGYRPVLDAGQAAKRNLSNIQALDSLDISKKTGWATETKAAAANILTGLGIAPEKAEKYAADSQIFNNILQQQTWTLLGAQKGPQTDGDAIRAQQTFSQLGNTPQANEFIKDLNRAANNQQIKQAEFYQQEHPSALQKGDLTRIEADWSKKSSSIWNDPIMKKWSKDAQASAAGAPVPKKAPDGNSYIPDPQRPGKYLQVIQ